MHLQNSSGKEPLNAFYFLLSTESVLWLLANFFFYKLSCVASGDIKLSAFDEIIIISLFHHGVRRFMMH